MRDGGTIRNGSLGHRLRFQRPKAPKGSVEVCKGIKLCAAAGVSRGLRSKKATVRACFSWVLWSSISEAPDILRFAKLIAISARSWRLR